MSKEFRNMAYELADDFLPFPKTKTKSRSLIIKVTDFSNETVHESGEPAESSFSMIKFGNLEEISLALFANGMTTDDKGYVTVEFRISSNIFRVFLKVFELSCVFRVIDASGNKRFPQSYVIHSHSYWSSFNQMYDPIIVDRLLKRDLLLGDKDDLLPGDCLSLHMDVDMRTIDYIPYIEPCKETRYVFSSFQAIRPKEIYLYLDSEIGRRLREVSTYFQRMLETPMEERKSRCMKVSHDEFPSLRDIGEILTGTTAFIATSIIHVCQMYITADKYDIPIAIESCRNLLSTLLRVENDPGTAEHVKENISTLLDLAETYNDVQLKENVESFLKNSREDGEGDRCTQKRLRSNLDSEWNFERYGDDNIIHYFRFENNIKKSPSGVNYYN